MYSVLQITNCTRLCGLISMMLNTPAPDALPFLQGQQQLGVEERMGVPVQHILIQIHARMVSTTRGKTVFKPWHGGKTQ